jgi:flagellar basal-body rod protein FlgC
MNDPLKAVMQVSASGMRAQTERLRVISENLANANSTAQTPGGDPYRRKTISFAQVMDQANGGEGVAVKRIGRDMSAFRMVYDPAHPAADQNGYVKMPNVNSLIEMSDMREATRTFEANLTMLEAGKAMSSKTIDILKS